MPTIVCETPRLRLRHLVDDDAPFIVRLLNDPEWIRFIGDRKIRSEDDARGYIAKVPVAMRARHGFTLDLVERKADGAAMGLCGLIKRDTLDDVDLGFALLPAYRGQGYAREAARAVLDLAQRTFALPRVVAITSPDNAPSIGLVESLGFRYQRTIRMTPDDAGTNVYLRDAPAPAPT
jgi:[ribosomal protein S5]-alanine N-acetyltransferase